MTNGEHPFSAHRRHIVQSRAAFTLSSIVSSLFATSTPVRADAISGKVPEIDDLRITSAQGR